jgi:hypothetical protein
LAYTAALFGGSSRDIPPGVHSGLPLSSVATLHGINMTVFVASVWRIVYLLSFFTVGPWLTKAVDYGVTSSHLRVSVRPDSLQDAPSCQHRIAQVELLNVVS